MTRAPPARELVLLIIFSTKNDEQREMSDPIRACKNKIRQVHREGDGKDIWGGRMKDAKRGREEEKACAADHGLYRKTVENAASPFHGYAGKKKKTGSHERYESYHKNKQK